MDKEAAALAATDAFAQTGAGGLALGDFWSLVEQAGPLRWPIFGLLAVGMVLVFLKLFELLRDRAVSRGLSGVDVASASLEQITRRVSGQDDSMLARLQSALLNVYHTRPGVAPLHAEISSFVVAERGQFGVFRRRMEFLSDTAGAMGLMGTVWGMFTVFFQGTSEQDVILRGMGIALITTLLGLVVSITLNFSATELSTFFERRLDQVSRKADELRFRLMELAVETGAPTREVALAEGSSSAVHGSAQEPMTLRHESPRSAAGPASAGVQATAVAGRNGARDAIAWCTIDVPEPPTSVEAGREIDDLWVIVRNGNGAPAPDTAVAVTLSGPGGSLNGNGRRARLRTDAEGRLRVPCTAPDLAGDFALDLALPDRPSAAARLDLEVRPGPAEGFAVVGNNQAVVAGMRLPQPLGVRATDRFGNPVPGIPVTFTVREGEGRLGGGESEQRVVTDGEGLASVPFAVSSVAGPNLVVAHLPDSSEPLRFVALGTEV